MNCRNYTTTIRPSVSTSYVYRHHCNDWIFPNGSVSTAMRPERSQPKVAAAAVPTFPAALQRNAPPTLIDGPVWIRRRHRWVRWVRNGRIVAHYCWAHRRKVITVKLDSQDGRPRTWIQAKHRRALRRAAHLRAADQTLVYCRDNHLPVEMIRYVHRSGNHIWDGEARRNCHSHEPHMNGTNYKWTCPCPLNANKTILIFVNFCSLASSMLTRQQGKQQSSQSSATDKAAQGAPVANESPAVTQEIQSSIKEVTSAIVHFVNDQSNRAASSNSRSRSTSPSSKWVKSPNYFSEFTIHAFNGIFFFFVFPIISEIVGWKVHLWAIDHWIHLRRLSLKPFHRAKSIHRASAYRRQQIASMASVSLAFCRPKIFYRYNCYTVLQQHMNTYTIYYVDDYCLIALSIYEYIMILIV